MSGSALAQTTVVTQTPSVTEVQTGSDTTGGGAADGATSGAIAGAAVSGPLGAAVGAVAECVMGDISSPKWYRAIRQIVR